MPQPWPLVASSDGTVRSKAARWHTRPRRKKRRAGRGSVAKSGDRQLRDQQPAIDQEAGAHVAEAPPTPPNVTHNASRCRLGTLAILGMPPFGVFASEFLILTTAMRSSRGPTPISAALGVASPRSSKVATDGIRRNDDAPAATCARRCRAGFYHSAGAVAGIYIPPIGGLDIADAGC